MPALLRINYGINRAIRRGSRKVIVHENHKLRVKGSIEDVSLHGKVLRRVKSKHPGWQLTGYAQAPEPRRRHVIMCQRQFVPAILAGTKLHTIRAERVRSIKPGDILDLRAWTGLPYRSKQEKLIERVCIGCTRIDVDSNTREIYMMETGGSWYYRGGPREIDLAEEKLALAQRDGFASAHAFFEFFRFTHAGLLKGQLIEWKA
jgi:hypothetical protein